MSNLENIGKLTKTMTISPVLSNTIKQLGKSIQDKSILEDIGKTRSTRHSKSS